MRRSRVTCLVLTTVLMSGCHWDGQDCTDIGGYNGILIEIAQELWVAEGAVTFTVCDDAGCESATSRMGRLAKGQGGGRPEMRPSEVSFEELGRQFDDGTVHVTVELTDDDTGRVVARREQEVELTRHWPNGKACDGDGYLSGSLKLTAEDAVASPA